MRGFTGGDPKNQATARAVALSFADWAHLDYGVIVIAPEGEQLFNTFDSAALLPLSAQATTSQPRRRCPG